MGAVAPICALDELPDPGALAFEAEGRRGFLVRSGETLSGFVDACPHTGASLSNGSDRYLTRDGARILCLQHGAVFRLADGVCIAGPCEGDGLTPWPIAIADGLVTTA